MLSVIAWFVRWRTSILPPADISNTVLHTGGQSPLEMTLALLYSSQDMKIQPFPTPSLYITVFCWVFESQLCNAQLGYQ